MTATRHTDVMNIKPGAMVWNHIKVTWPSGFYRCLKCFITKSLVCGGDQTAMQWPWNIVVPKRNQVAIELSTEVWRLWAYQVGPIFLF